MISSEGRGQRSLTYLAAFCPLVSTTLSPHVHHPSPHILQSACGHPAQGGSPGSHPPPPLSGCFSLKEKTCQEGLHSPGSLNFLSPFIMNAFIWCIHFWRAPGQEPLLATFWMKTSHLSGQSFCLPFPPLETNKIMGLPWWSSGLDSMLPAQGTPVLPLLRELDLTWCN